MYSRDSLLTALHSGECVVAAELRPPRAELAGGEGMNAWIDTYHAVRTLTRNGRFVFLTDSAIGTEEEDNIRHLVTNLGTDVPRERIVPFLTSKHSIEYCLSYTERAHQSGFPAIVVLGGDKSIGTPRVVGHAWQLRERIRGLNHAMTLGGWANPHADPERQVQFLLAPDFNAEFYLTQIVSHHNLDPVRRFIDAAARHRLALPGLFGVFFYRSANPRTLSALKSYLPVPADALARDFESGASAEDICARSVRALLDAGAKHFYVSNLPIGRAHEVLAAILKKVGSGSDSRERRKTWTRGSLEMPASVDTNRFPSDEVALEHGL